MPAGPVHHIVESSPSTTVAITGTDGQKYEMKIAILVMGVVDTGMTNPIDLLPIFNVASQVILQVKQKADA